MIDFQKMTKVKPKEHPQSEPPTLTHDSKPPDFFPMFAYGGAGIVSIISPGGVTKMDDEIAVVGGHTIVEIDLANTLPVSNG